MKSHLELRDNNVWEDISNNDGWAKLAKGEVKASRTNNVIWKTELYLLAALTIHVKIAEKGSMAGCIKLAERAVLTELNQIGAHAVWARVEGSVESEQLIAPTTQIVVVVVDVFSQHFSTQIHSAEAAWFNLPVNYSD